MKAISRTVVLVILGLIVLSGVALAGGFSADIISVSGGEKMTGKMFVSQNKMRFETDEMITITRMDKRVVWMLMPGEKMYMERALPGVTIIPSNEPAQDETERVLIGTESFDGKTVDKYKVSIKSGGKADSHYQWIAKDSGFPLKMEAIDGSWRQEYRNLSFSEPSGALFEVPADYQKMQMPF